jgi:type IV secretory pathway VirB2 component (pilin)
MKNGGAMKTSRKSFGIVWKPILAKTVTAGSIALSFATVALAQQGGGSPWENAVNVLQQAFTGTIAKGLALVAIVVGGLTFAFGPSKQTLLTL